VDDDDQGFETKIIEPDEYAILGISECEK